METVAIDSKTIQVLVAKTLVATLRNDSRGPYADRTWHIHLECEYRKWVIGHFSDPMYALLAVPIQYKLAEQHKYYPDFHDRYGSQVTVGQFVSQLCERNIEKIKRPRVCILGIDLGSARSFYTDHGDTVAWPMICRI